ncbi:MAG: hypothetical protein HY815_23140 [Candidatus Riflebacteria bacterium]|nr:hypothetical protein [Candidatus Riflebacteria bacterium]
MHAYRAHRTPPGSRGCPLWSPWAVVIVLLVTGAASAAPDPRLAPIEKMVADATPGGMIVKALEGLPLEVRQTADYHLLLARAHQIASEPWLSGEALAFFRHLEPGSTRDTRAVEQWLAREADRLFTEAMSLYRNGDLPAAADAYLKAVQCDQTVLARPENGLGEQTLSTLRAALNQGGHASVNWYGLGFLDYRHDHLRAARSAFEEYLRKAKDPYWAWRANVWMRRIDAEIEVVSRARRDEARAKAEASARAAADSVRHEKVEQQQRLERQRAEAGRRTFERRRHLLELDARIREADLRIEALQRQRTGQVSVDGYGSTYVMAVNQRLVKSELVEMTQVRAELAAEREDLEREDLLSTASNPEWVKGQEAGHMPVGSVSY